MTYRQSNIEGVMIRDNTDYCIEPNVAIEISEGQLCLTTYDPSPIQHDIDIQEDTILRNSTNTKQYIYTKGMVGPVSKQVQNEIVIKKGRQKNV